MDIRTVLLVIFSGFLGLSCATQEPKLLPFAEVKASYERRLAEAKQKYLSDSANAQALAAYAEEGLKKLKFERETSPRESWATRFNSPVLVDLQQRLERAISRDTNSMRLAVLLGRIYAERHARLCGPAAEYGGSHSFPDWLQTTQQWRQSVDRARLHRTVELMQKAVDIDTAFSEYRYELVRLMVADDESFGALLDLMRSVTERGIDIDTAFSKYRRELHRPLDAEGSLLGAGRKLLESYVKSNPKDGKAWYYLGMTYSEFFWWMNHLVDMDRALRYLVEARKHPIDDALIAVDINRHLDFGLYGVNWPSDPSYRKKVKRVPGVAQGMILSGAKPLWSTKARRKALLSRALEINPYCYDALLELAAIRYQPRQYPTSEFMRLDRRRSEIDRANE